MAESRTVGVVLPQPILDALAENARTNDRSLSREIRRACVFYLKHVDTVQQLGTSAAAETIATRP
jgi:hypothetical protein